MLEWRDTSSAGTSGRDSPGKRNCGGGRDGRRPASVVGGLVEVPVIAVPTSVGYGASFHGLSALLTMLNERSAGVTVVNIDNGFGAGFAASQINKKYARQSRLQNHHVQKA